MSKWVGYAVSVNCGEPLGCYQGTILDADGSTLTLTKAFRNGFPYPKSQVTLNAADIKELKIIEARAEAAGPAHSTVAVSKGGKKAARATVCENLQANPSSSGNQVSQTPCGKPGNTRSKPIDIQGARSGKNNNHAGSGGGGGGGGAGSTPKARGGGGGGGGDKARRRNEACFGDAADPSLDADFDFEGNLALFDKRALWRQMNNQKPDLVRQTDEAGKYRHDENILGDGGGGAGAARAIRVPDELRGAVDYVSDEGVCVPALEAGARAALWAAVARAGLLEPTLALLARAAADVCVRLVGGGRRLEPRNRHQAPVVAVAAGAHAAGAAALLAARLLASHGARVAALAAGGGGGGAAAAALAREAAALGPAGVARVPCPRRLPRADLLLLALHDPLAIDTTDYSYIEEWAMSARTACVSLEGGAGAAGAGVAGEGVSCRATVQALLPAALPPRAGRLYLADVAPPPTLFQELRIRYEPPFGAHSLLALHPADE